METNDETENDAPEDEVEGGGRACRQKGWWKPGEVETKLNTVNSYEMAPFLDATGSDTERSPRTRVLAVIASR